MSLTKPTSIPEWALNPDPNAIATPSIAKIDSGFLNQERPPRQDHNYLFNLLGQWRTWEEQVNQGPITQTLTIGASIGTFTLNGSQCIYYLHRDRVHLVAQISINNLSGFSELSIVLPTVLGPSATPVQLILLEEPGFFISGNALNFQNLTASVVDRMEVFWELHFPSGTDKLRLRIEGSGVPVTDANGFAIYLNHEFPVRPYWDDANF